MFEDSIKTLKDFFNSLPAERNILTISQWAAEKRYLPAELTPNPGFWNNDLTPYLVEPMDCLSPVSEINRVIIMKGTQGGFTTGIIENFIGYTIDENPSSMMYISADAKLTEGQIEVKIDKMIDQVPGLKEKIKPAVVKKHHKASGDTKGRKDFVGGFMIAVGARSPGKLRSFTIKYLMLDEVDGYPLSAGREGDPINLAVQRTKNFGSSRKEIYISTPLIKQTSRIYRLYEEGGKRQFYVPCLKCKTMQTLEFFPDKEKNNRGLHYEKDDQNRLIPGSVYYQCIGCDHKIRDFEKPAFLLKGEWRPEIDHRPVDDRTRSYFWTPLLSPWHTWTNMVVSYLKIGSIEERKSFYNTELGLPWEEMGERPSVIQVNSHRRLYQSKKIPNKLANKETGGDILFLTVAVDTQDNGCYYDISGWTKNGNLFQIEFDFLKGDNTKPEFWEKLKERIHDNAEYKDEKGKKYKTYFGVIDAGGHRTREVYDHCLRYGKYFLIPIMGQRYIYENNKKLPWKKQEDKPGYPGLLVYSINTTYFKNELAKKLKQERKQNSQPKGYLNFPQDRGSDYFEQFTAEQYIIEKDPRTNLPKLMYWKQIGQRANHAWDCQTYQQFALEIFAYVVCVTPKPAGLGLKELDFISFWQHAETGVFES
jgi:phage terminase large subunit GpA-like protein